LLKKLYSAQHQPYYSTLCSTTEWPQNAWKWFTERDVGSKF